MSSYILPERVNGKDRFTFIEHMSNTLECVVEIIEFDHTCSTNVKFRHVKELSLRKFGKLLPFRCKDGLPIFDDVHWKGVKTFNQYKELL